MNSLCLTELPLDKIESEDTQRDPTKGLIRSLSEDGLLRPIDVRERGDSTYELVDGSRRVAAARQLGWRVIDAVVEPPGAGSLPRDLKALLLNTQRQNLGALYLARHARRLLLEKGWTQTELAQRIHRSRSALCKMLKVLDCPDLVAAVERHELEFGAARAVAPLPPADRRSLLAELNEITKREGKMPSVRQVEERVRCRQGGAPTIVPSPENLTEATEALQLRGIPVEIQARTGKASCVRITLTLTEADNLWLSGVLDGEPAPPVEPILLPRGNNPMDARAA